MFQDMFQDQAPIVEALGRLRRETISFHTPGHKQGKRGSDLLTSWLRQFLMLDLTEIADLDSIHHPTGPILESEQLAAHLYGVKSTYFTTNGATAGVIGSLLAAAPPGSSVIVPRNVHLSILSAMVLGDLLPRFVQPTYWHGQLLPLSAVELRAQLASTPDAAAVVIVSPSYQGAVPDLNALVRLAHAAGCRVVVDEAHGPHLAFHPDLPISAVRSDADLVVQSAHKLLSALTGGAWVHRNSDSLSDEQVRGCLNLVQSTSPLWPVLGSLDLARLEMATEGKQRLQQIITNARCLREMLIDAGFLIREAPSAMGYAQDPLKINLISRGKGYAGQELANHLAAAGIYPEMTSPDGLLLLLGMGDCRFDFAPLSESLATLPTKRPLQPSANWQVPPLPDLVLRPREAYFRPLEWIELHQATGRIAARSLYAYPPGIPLLYPGEKIEQGLIDYIQDQRQLGTDLTGLKGTAMAVVE
jgi:arginine/lysine/ornithine decarboxylase